MVEADEAFESLLEFLKDARGFDFTGYKRTTLSRRVTKRMNRVGIDTYAGYLDYLQVHPAEFSELFDEILINVTSFFRDPEAWGYLGSTILPELTASASLERPLRCWCAGVASGEEAYSLAMLLAEHLGTADFAQRVKIYATDVDDGALTAARTAGHGSREIEAVPDELRARYFEKVADRYLFRPDLRRAIIFSRHDIVHDAPISRLDLLVCRNTLMYFTPEAQVRILSKFHYALRDTGYLFLGRAEMMLTHADLFTPVEMHHRIFRKVPRVSVRDRLAVLAGAAQPEVAVADNDQIRLLERVSDALPAAQVVVDDAGAVAVINHLARKWFRLEERDLGRPLQDLELSYRPVELRSLIEKAYVDGRELAVRNVQRAVSETEIQYLDVHVTPLVENGRRIGASIAYMDVTSYNALQTELERSRNELETAYEELQSTNEELETTNEELQSTVEELETTNEELQSGNEELETMNEELESTNSELQMTNTELRERTTQVDEGNSFFESVLTSLRLAMIVVDGDLRVKLWRGRAEDMWGLGASEVRDRPLTDLDIGLPTRELRQLVRACLNSPDEAQVATVEATDRRGRPIRCRIVANVLRGRAGAVTGVILLIDDNPAAPAAS